MKPPFTILGTSDHCLRLVSDTKPEDVISLLGVPMDSWDDDVEHCLTYHEGELLIRFYWDVTLCFGRRRLRFRNADLEFPTSDSRFTSSGQVRRRTSGEQAAASDGDQPAILDSSFHPAADEL